MNELFGQPHPNVTEVKVRVKVAQKRTGFGNMVRDRGKRNKKSEKNEMKRFFLSLTDL